MEAFSPKYDVSFSSSSEPFSFRITRRANGLVLFDTTGMPFVFKDQYVLSCGSSEVAAPAGCVDEPLNSP